MSEALKSIESIDGILTEFTKFEHFAKVLLDAFALVDNNGRIVKANQMLAQLTGQKIRQLQKADTIDAIIKFQLDGVPMGFKEILEYESPIRIDEVRGQLLNQDNPLNLILGVYPFTNQSTGEKLGFFLLIRDVTAETNLQDQYKNKAIQSITDPLTTLFTRAYFEEYLSGQIIRMEALPVQERYQLSLVMCDIDFFKKINDKYGHQAGDYVLKNVARIMKQSFRKTDVCCRYGGEEFLVILPAASFENTGIAANKLRQAIQDEVIIFDEKHIPVTMSCGVATISIGQESYTEAMARADAALYDSKHNGRNMVSMHDGTKIINTARTLTGT
ncbi:MAG: sensor domain-containing diguanylate cyclase [Proteobacteria bacterium]|nr:sensor domain-containing diguanylate cyclase [Pseudomonadota bacterium]